MKEEVLNLVCDLCGHKGQMKRLTDSDWMEICFDDPMVDRSWVYRQICGRCVQKVLDAAKRRAKAS